MKKDYIMAVDEKDNELDLVDKIKAHTTKPQLHRAITCLLTNKKGEYLITKRAKSKLLWPEIWETSCSTHPLQNESYEVCAERRIKEELGVEVKIKLIDKFVYRTKYKNIGSENEVCALLVGKIEKPIKPDKNEVSDYKFISSGELKKEMQKKPDSYAPWLKIAVEKLN
jgi:isopentenyl-diphosphate delta-isomerase